MKINLIGVFALSLLVNLFSAAGVPAPNLKFGHLSVEEGLSQGNVWDVYQDKLGFIWIATEYGLNRYDAYSFKVFKYSPLDSFSINSNNIRCITEDAQGNLWIGTRNGLNLYNRDLDRFERFIKDDNKKESISSNLINCLLFDSDGRLWIGTENGVNLFNPETKIFLHFLHDEKNNHSLANNSVRTILEDRQKRIWIGTGNGLSLLNKDHATFTRFVHEPDDPLSLSSNVITSLYQDKHHILWVGTFDGGLNERRPQQNGFIHHVHADNRENSLSNNYVYDLAEDSNGILWIATDHGLNRKDLRSNSFLSYNHDPDDRSSLSSDIITKIYFDRNNRMWIGSRFGGLNIHDKNKNGFITYQYQKNDKHSLSHNTISGFKEDRNGNFWIATDGGSLNYFNKKSNTFNTYPNTFTNNKVLAVEKDPKGNLWIGMWKGGLDRFDPVTKKIKHYHHDPEKPNSLSDDNVFYILCDQMGDIWVATWGNGINRYNPKSDDFTRYVHDPQNPNSLASPGTDFLFEDSKGNIWIGTETNGVDRFNPRSNIFTHYQTKAERGSLTNNFISALFEDSAGRIWVGTYGGLNLFDPKTETFDSFHEHDGLPNDAIMGIQEDNHDKLWISTNQGISRFDPQTKVFENFTVRDGLQGDQFNRWASAKLSTGELLFGGTNGFTLFHPDSIKSNTFIPPIYITDFKVSSKPVKIGENEILKKNILQTTEIHLSYRENIFSFEFAGLNYLQAEKNRYRYKMDGFQEEWVEASGERKATYTNLNPGQYVFRVKGSNNDGVWNENGASIKIIITPAYWQTWWFRALIAATVIGSVIAFFILRMNVSRRQKIRLEEKIQRSTAEIREQKETLEAQAENMQTLNDQLQSQTNFLQQQREEAERMREEAEVARQEAEKANRAKSIFLATMSHEIRTPMNGVLGMASLLAETPLSAEQQEYTDTIRGSGEALLTVINDILDFSKIESGNLELEHHAFDLRQCVEEVMDIFSTRAAQKGLDLVYQIDYQVPAQIIGDSHRLRQVLLNLIGNAMKFTERGEIFVGIDLLKLDADQLELAFQVRDTGIGIPEDKRSRLFKAFSQVDSSTTRKYGGTGLGLVIAQRLIELMGGSIEVESQPGVGTSFVFIIHALINQESIRQYVNTHLTGNEGKKILVVDDNATNLTILKTQLEQWRLLPTLASSGSQALHLLDQGEKFDLVITDMQMPDMDGVQFTQQIKKGYAALPVILLSSIGDESKKKYPGLFSWVLNKPVKQQQLRKVLHSVFRPEGEKTPSEEQKPRQILSSEFAKKYPLKMLVAEDNPINQKLIVRALNKLGYQSIEMAQNGLEAVEIFNEEFYDVILMDVQMPEMDGLEATRLIRQKQYHQPVIIAMTANAMQGDREQCISAGMDDYVSKPVKLETLVEVLEKWAVILKDKASIYPQ